MKILPFGEVCTLEYGKPLDKEFRKSDGDFLAYGANGPISSASKYLIEGPCVIVGRKGSAGEITLVESNVWPLDVTYYIKHNLNETDLRYLFYALKSLNIKQFVRGVKPGLNRNDVYELPIPLPSLEKQREIVKKLDKAFLEIELLEENLELTDKKANQLLLSLLFESFDQSVTNQASNNLTGNQNLPSTSRSESVRLGDLCDAISGLWTGKKPPFEKATVIRNTNFTKDCKLDLSNVAILDVETKQLQTRQLIPGDLIIEKSGGGPKQAVGRVVHFNENSGTYSLSNFTSALRIKDLSLVLSKYLQRFLYLQYVSGVTESMQSNSTGIRNLNIHKFLEIPVPLPHLEKQHEIVEKLDLVFAEIETIRNQIAVERDFAVMLRQSLLSDAFSSTDEMASA